MLTWPYLLAFGAGGLAGWLARSFTARRQLLRIINRLDLERQDWQPLSEGEKS